MSKSEIAGQELFWREWGAETAGGVKVLALHCALAHGGTFGPLAAALPEAHLLAPDLPGHGESADLPEGGDFHDLSTEIAADLAARLGGGAPVHIIGHSFGASVALRLGLEQPQLCQSLTLIEPPLFAAARGSTAYPESEAHNRAVAELMETDPAAAAALFHREWGGGIPFEALPERQRQAIILRMPLIGQPTPVLSGDRLGMLNKGRLEALDLPVLLVEGSRSPAVAHAIQTHLEHRLPRVVRLRIEGAAHMAPISHPARIAEAFRANIRRK